MNTFLQELQDRGLINQLTDTNKINQILDKKATLYCGFEIITATAGNFYIAAVGGTTVKPAGGTLDVAATAGACSNATSNTLVLTSI